MTVNQINAKRYLFHVASLPRRIESKMLEIEVMRAKAEGLGTIRYDKERVQTSPEDRMPDAVIELIEFINRLDKDHLELVNERNRADGLMEYLNDEQRDVIDYYFFQNKNFYEISTLMNYSERTIKTRYYDGLEIIGEHL